MDCAAPPLESLHAPERRAPLHAPPHALELRVSEGPQRGARVPLVNGGSCVIATGPDAQDVGADIVLSDDQAASSRVRLNAAPRESRIEVLQGQVKLGDRVISPGEVVTWAARAPLSIGSAVLTFGLADGRDGKAVTPAHLDETAKPSGDAEHPQAVAPWRRRADVWLAATGTAVLLLCGAAVGYASLQTPTASQATSPLADPVAELSRSLRQSEFRMLDVTTRGNGQVVIRGRLATESQRENLAQRLLHEPLAPTVEVTVDEALVREVSEVFRINGIAVSAEVAGPGRITAEVAERDGDALARAEEAVRRDVKGIEALSVRNTAKPPPPPAAPVIDDPGKRIASLVGGASAYLVTVDGARYFVGAMLPTGHRIVGIEKTAVALERDGQRTSLNF